VPFSGDHFFPFPEEKIESQNPKNLKIHFSFIVLPPTCACLFAPTRTKRSTSLRGKLFLKDNKIQDVP
jgi:hypothetical protein